MVVTIEVDEQVRWFCRPEDHPTLDQCEAMVTRGAIVEVHIGCPDHLSSTEHNRIKMLQEQFRVPVSLLDSFPERS